MPSDRELGKLLPAIKAGKVQLPDFQREWKWDDEHIRSLLATLTLGYPMGAVMTLETGGDGARLKARPLAGTESPADAHPEQLLLDGQQRLTSLYRALLSDRPVETKDPRGKKLQRWYYIDIDKATGGIVEREDAVLSVPENRVVPGEYGRGVALDLTTREKECAAGVFPMRLIFDSDETVNWQVEYLDGSPERLAKWKAFQREVLNKVTGYDVPVIELTKDTSKEAVCMVFEKVNTGGVSLNVFELLTATYAGNRAYFDAHGQDFQLSNYWKQTQQELSDAHPVFGESGERDFLLQSTDFLQAVTLVATYQRRRARHTETGDAPALLASCKRRDILNLTLEEFLTWAPQVSDAFRWTARFLARQCVFHAVDVPYRGQLVPLTAVRAVLGERADELRVEEKLSRWYWCGVLGEVYGGSPESRYPRDLEQVLGWLDGRDEPGTMAEATFQEGRLTSLNSRNSAAYKGVYALLLKQECVDWFYNKGPIDYSIVEDHQVNIHHVFPKAWCDKNHVTPQNRDSIVNKTPLSARATRTLAGRAPDVYLHTLERETGLPPEWLDDVVSTHQIEPGHLRSPNFEAFYQARSDVLLTLIAKAMGKDVVRAHQGPQEQPQDFESASDEPSEYAASS